MHVLFVISNRQLLLLALVSTLSFFQMIVLFLIAYNLLRWPQVMRACLLTLCLAVALLAAMSWMGITISEKETTAELAYRYTRDVDDLRKSAFGVDSNYIGFLYGLGALCCLGLISQRTQMSAYWMPLLWPCLGLCVHGLISSGSRGATAAFAASMLPLLMAAASGKKASQIIWAAFAVGLVAFGFSKLLSGSNVAAARWQETMSTGMTSDRFLIWATCLQQAKGTWLIGEGMPMAEFDLGRRLLGYEVQYATHNEFLNMLLSVGAPAAFCVLGAWLLCLSSAWRARREGMAATATAAVILALIVSCDVVVCNRKIFWLTLAMAFAAGRMIPQAGSSMQRSYPKQARQRGAMSHVSSTESATNSGGIRA